MTTLLKQFISAVIFAAVFSFLVSCSEQPNQPLATVPKIGSTYTYNEVALDEQGDTLTAMSSSTDTLIATDIDFGSQSNVHLFRRTEDSTLLKLSESGSFEMFQDTITIMNGLGFPPIWIPYNANNAHDTIYHSSTPTTVNGLAGTLTLQITTKGTGTATHTINGKMLTVENSESIITVEVAIEGMGTVSTTTVTSRFSYAPKLRYFVREEVITYSDSPFSPVKNGTELRELVGYTLN